MCPDLSKGEASVQTFWSNCSAYRQHLVKRVKRPNDTSAGLPWSALPWGRVDEQPDSGTANFSSWGSELRTEVGAGGTSAFFHRRFWELGKACVCLAPRRPRLERMFLFFCVCCNHRVSACARAGPAPSQAGLADLARDLSWPLVNTSSKKMPFKCAWRLSAKAPLLHDYWAYLIKSTKAALKVY